MNKTLMMVQFGSHLYGTATPASDLDYKAVHVPDARSILLQRVQGSVNEQRHKASEGEKNMPADVDSESYALHRYLELLTSGQTVAVDMLFAPIRSLLVCRQPWLEICNNRHRLLTKKSAAFVGYCRAQANKYGIKGSRVAAAQAASEWFAMSVLRDGTTTKIGDCESAMRALLLPNHSENMEIVTKETAKGHEETYFQCCNRMVGFKNTVKEAATIFARIYEEYGKRARMAQDNQGIDWKALSHAVRVAHEAIELLESHEITFPLANAAHIREIKQGSLPYTAVAEEIEQLLGAVEAASEKSSLPHDVDHEFIDDLVIRVYRHAVKAG